MYITYVAYSILTYIGVMHSVRRTSTVHSRSVILLDSFRIYRNYLWVGRDCGISTIHIYQCMGLVSL